MTLIILKCINLDLLISCEFVFKNVWILLEGFIITSSFVDLEARVIFSEEKARELTSPTTILCPHPPAQPQLYLHRGEKKGVVCQGPRNKSPRRKMADSLRAYEKIPYIILISNLFFSNRKNSMYPKEWGHGNSNHFLLIILIHK